MTLLRAAIPVALLAIVPTAAPARDLVMIPVVDHFPLHLDKGTLKRNGSVATFSYVLAVPKGLGKNSPEGWQSTEVEASLDCKAETYSLGKVTIYSEPLAQGTVVREAPAPAESRQYDIQPRSTALYLAQFICGW